MRLGGGPSKHSRPNGWVDGMSGDCRTRRIYSSRLSRAQTFWFEVGTPEDPSRVPLRKIVGRSHTKSWSKQLHKTAVLVRNNNLPYNFTHSICMDYIPALACCASRRLRPTSRTILGPALVRDAVGGRSQALEGCRGNPRSGAPALGGGAPLWQAPAHFLASPGLMRRSTRANSTFPS